MLRIAKELQSRLPALYGGKLAKGQTFNRTQFPSCTVFLNPYSPCAPRFDGNGVGSFSPISNGAALFDLKAAICLFSLEHFFPGVIPTCPKCHSQANVRRSGWARYTKRCMTVAYNGLFIYSGSYTCDCGAAFDTHHPMVYKELPEWVKLQLPFVICPSPLDEDAANSLNSRASCMCRLTALLTDQLVPLIGGRGVARLFNGACGSLLWGVGSGKWAKA